MWRIIEYYDFIFTKTADRRTATWPLISSPLPLLALVAAYLYCVYIFLPTYMANRKPYSLKKYIAFYNIFQVIACCVVIYGISTSGWTMNYILHCQKLDVSDDPIAIRMAHYIWLYFIVKVIELTETFVFILRKKARQVSPLHVYHHSTTVLYAWLGVKYYPGGMGAFPFLLNSFVHIIMYSYYFLSSLGPNMQTKLQVIKSKITVIQIIQLVILMVCALQILSPNCSVPTVMFYITLPNLIINLILFLGFYTKHYRTKTT